MLLKKFSISTEIRKTFLLLPNREWKIHGWSSVLRLKKDSCIWGVNLARCMTCELFRKSNLLSCETDCWHPLHVLWVLAEPLGYLQLCSLNTAKMSKCSSTTRLAPDHAGKDGGLPQRSVKEIYKEAAQKLFAKLVAQDSSALPVDMQDDHSGLNLITQCHLRIRLLL